MTASDRIARASDRAPLTIGLALAGLVGILATSATAQEAPARVASPRPDAPTLPPIPVPDANPMTEAKILLGKALFWDEQMSADDTVACGTCHRPAAGGADPRFRRNPGPDGELETVDDVFGSPGIAPVSTPDGTDERARLPQVTARVAPTVIDALYAPDLFWDGRATSRFVDPETGAVRIESGGALESQALGPILSPIEMAHPGRDWAKVTGKLAKARPLALAAELPVRLAEAAGSHATYAAWFEAVFGPTEEHAEGHADRVVTPTRIAFAIASYERTLRSDQTPYDLWAAGDDDAMTERQIAGFREFRRARCAECHPAPHFTDHQYRNIGVRPVGDDQGRAGITGNRADRGKFKVPTLRNVGLRTRLMHNGEFDSLRAAIVFYHPAMRFGRDRSNLDQIIGRGLPLGPPYRIAKSPLIDFLEHALTDPRAANELPPFDRPKRKSER